MELIAKADVVLALGTRLNPFSTLPGYGIDYWPGSRPSSRWTSTPTASA
jgi:sulfoacetaldehyde acetyltransferase